MSKYRIVYGEDQDGENIVLKLPDGRESDPMDYPETGLGLVTVGNEMFAIVTPDHDGDGNHLEHDTVYKLIAVPTEVEGDFQEEDDEVVEDEGSVEVAEGDEGEEEGEG